MSKIDYGEIGKNIRIHRAQKNLKQKDLAEKINVSAQHISHIETGRAQPSLPVLVDIANALDTDINTLLGANLSTGRKKILEAQIAEELEGATVEVLEHILAFCREEIQFYRKILGLSN